MGCGMIKGIIKILVGSSILSKAGWLKRNGTRWYSISRFEEIDGWLSLDEVNTLFDVASELSGDLPIVVEIGVWQERSIAMSLSASAARTPIHSLFAILRWGGFLTAHPACAVRAHDENPVQESQLQG